MTALQTLRRAASFMNHGRWVKEEMQGEHMRINTATGRRFRQRHGKPVTCYCAAGALQAAAHGSGDLTGAQNFLLRAIGRDPATHGEDDIYVWNDQRWRTLGSVRKAFDRAIALARKARDDKRKLRD